MKYFRLDSNLAATRHPNTKGVRTIVGILATATFLLATPSARAQSSAVVESDSATVAYQESLKTWKQGLAALRVAIEAHDELKAKGVAKEELLQATQLIKQKLDEAEQLVPQLRQSATMAYAAHPEQDRELSRLLLDILTDDLKRDNYDDAYIIAKALIDGKCEDKKLLDGAGMAAFATHHFEEAAQYWKKAVQNGTLDNSHRPLLAVIPEYIGLWQQERAIREKEAQEDNLPRVKLTTNKGDIVIELFENEAPETVGNFVSLVEKGYYDGLTFHRVLEHFMAQGGCPRGDGSGGPGYNIYCECYKPEYRRHFRGSVSMAKTERRDSGGSQFFLTFVPTPQLNGLHTVFGRVVDGFPVLAKIQRRDPQKQPAPNADKILKAEVVRKRDHSYVPTKTQ